MAKASSCFTLGGFTVIRLRHISAALLLSLCVQTTLEAQTEVPPQDDAGPDVQEGPSDGPPSATPAPRLDSSKPGTNGLAQKPESPGADQVPEGQELVSIDFPEPTEIKDIIRAVALWTGKNVIIGKSVSGKIQMISPRKVTKEEAYQAFLSALNVAGYTTVETGKVIKIVPTSNALKDNLNIYQGTTWAPRTDKLITQIVPLRYIDARTVHQTLSTLVQGNAIVAYQPTNTLIISDTGYKVKRILKIIEMLDVAGQQPKVALVPIRYGDAKTIASKIQEFMTAGAGTATPGKGAATSGRVAFKISVDERSNSVVIFGPPRTIQDVKDLVKKFDFPIDDPANQAAIRVRFLDYADAKKIAATLSSLASGQASSTSRRIGASPVRSIGQPGATTRGSEPAAVAELDNNMKITADESSNSLLITGSRSAYEAINGIIRKLDRRRPQVYVESDILDVNLGNDFSFGTSLMLGSKNGSSVQAYGWQGTQAAPLVLGQSAAAAGGQASEVVKGQIAQSLGRDFTIGVLSSRTFNVPGLGEVSPAGLITMLKSDANTRVLSSPHLLTSNNELAKIVVGDKIFYKTAVTSSAIGQGSIEKVEKEDADLSLEIKPNISSTGKDVTMKIDLQANEGGLDPANGLPRINKRQTSQIVSVRNGQTVVVSGLVKRRETEAFQKIPLLGDIPILGWLFRNSTIEKDTTSLMIFLTPHVVYGPNDLAAIYDKRVAERDNLMESVWGLDKDDEFFNALPTKEAGRYRPDEVDALEDKANDELRRQMIEDRGLTGPTNSGVGGGPINPTPSVPEAEDDLGGDDTSTLPVPMNNFDDGGIPDAGVLPPDGGNIPPPPPPPPSEPIDIPEQMDAPPIE